MFLLCSQIRIVIDMFGILTIRNAWFNASQVTDRTIQGYTKVGF